MSYEKIVLVTRKTRLETLVERFNTRAQAKFYIEHGGGDFDSFELEHQRYQAALVQLNRGLKQLAKVQTIERGFLPNFLFGENDLVVTIGIDGLVVNTAKYLREQPIIAANPDPEHIDGILLPFDVGGAVSAAEQAMQGDLGIQSVTMAEARLNDGQSLLAFNDLFIGRHDHVSARYQISSQGRSEHHSSSGVIISTGAGATGWLSSLFNMANGMMAEFASQTQSHGLTRPALSWDSNHLLFVVREPFISKQSGAEIVCGKITREAPLQLRSAMPDGGVIFSDGVATDYLAFNAGMTVTVGLAAQRTKLVIPRN
jgi:NAD kinase